MQSPEGNFRVKTFPNETSAAFLAKVRRKNAFSSMILVTLNSTFSPFLYLKQGPRNLGGGVVSIGFVVI